MTMTETATEPDVFGEFDSIAAVMGFIHHTNGDEGLVELLATIEDPDRESLERYAEELDKVGLARAAELVREHAANILGAGSECPFQEGTTRCRDWMRRNRRIFKGFQITEDTEE
jgi:hypothetical protein